MPLSSCKIIKGTHKTSRGKLLLTVELIKGQLKTGDCIYLKQQYFSVYSYKIEKVKKSLLDKHYELTIKFEEPEWMWKERIEEHILNEDETAICAISIEDYFNLSSHQKLEYITQLTSFISPGYVSDFLNHNFRFSNKLIIKEREGEIGLTKFGGLPIGSSEVYFPKDSNGKSALFIGQLHIAEINQWFEATKEFKGTGVLYFFATIKNEDEYETFDEIKVLYSNNIQDIQEIPLPDDIIGYGIFEEQDLMVAEEISIPPYETSLLYLQELSEDERNRYWYIEGILSQLYVFSGPKILGHPNQIQGCLLLEAELKSTKKGGYDPGGFDNDTFPQLIKESEPGAVTWRLLFELDPLEDYFRNLDNYGGEFNKYMDGRFYVMIKQEDLQNMNFNNTVTIYQCT